MPKSPPPPPLPNRKPVFTSSKISRMPNSSVSARIAWWKPGWGMMPCALPSTGSTMIAAMSSPSRSNSRRRNSTLLYRAGMIVLAAASGMRRPPAAPPRAVALAPDLRRAALVLAGERDADAPAHPLVDVVVHAVVAVAEDDRPVAHAQVHVLV